MSKVLTCWWRYCWEMELRNTIIIMNIRISSLLVSVVSRISLSLLSRVVWCQSGVSRALIGGLLWGCAWPENGISCEALPASRAGCQSPDVCVGEWKWFWSLNRGDCFLFHLPKWRRIDIYDSLFPPVPYSEREREMSKMLGVLPRVELTGKRKWKSSGNKHSSSSKHEAAVHYGQKGGKWGWEWE